MMIDCDEFGYKNAKLTRKATYILINGDETKKVISRKLNDECLGEMYMNTEITCVYVLVYQ